MRYAFELVEKGSRCFWIDPPSALRRWAGGFRLVTFTTFLQEQGRRKNFLEQNNSYAGALPPAPPPAFEKAGPKLYFFYNLQGVLQCNAVRLSFWIYSRYSFRYSLGDIPTIFLKAVEKLWLSEKPMLAAMAVMGTLVLVSCRLAISIFCTRM